MRIIDCNIIEINRGDELLFDYQVINGKAIYEFIDGDRIGFYIYKKGQLDKDPVLSKEFLAESGMKSIEIQVSAEDMQFGTVQNIPQEYWYEITLNDEVTLGYDDRGPKKLMLYPKGKK